MGTKHLSTSRRPRTPPLEPPRAAKARGDAGLVVGLSVPTKPLMSIIERHVKMSAAAKAALEQDLAHTLQHAAVQVSAVPRGGENVDTEQDDVLSTEQAARLLGVSRPFVVKLIDSGAIEMHQRVGNQRRVLKSAALRWRANERAHQAKALKRLADDLDGEVFDRA